MGYFIVQTNDAERMMQPSKKRVLLVGHFSTFGDIEVLEVAMSWLRKNGLEYDVSPYSSRVHLGFTKCVNGRAVNPSLYSHLIVVCGPHAKATEERYPEIFSHFSHAVKIGFNLSIIESADGEPDFDFLFARDKHKASFAQPDVSLLREAPERKLGGLCFVHQQREYGAMGRANEAAARLHALADRSDIATIRLETAWPPNTNPTGMKDASAFNEVCSRLDVLFTTRLHGLVLGLRAGVPVVALDSVSGGGKLSKQARILGWPEAFQIESVTDDELDAAAERCLSGQYTSQLSGIVEKARDDLSSLEFSFADAINNSLPHEYREPTLAQRMRRTLSGWNHQRQINRKRQREASASKSKEHLKPK